MLQNWLKTIPAQLVKTTGQLPKNTLGPNMLLFHGQLPDLKKVRVAIIGAGEKEANAVREQLYRYENPFPAMSVADLGNLRKNEASFLIPVLYELLSGKIVPIVIGTKNDLARAQFLAYQDTKALVNMVAIDETYRGQDVYDAVLHPRHPLLFHFGQIGLQVHQTPAADIEMMQNKYFDLIRLGKSRSALEETEPVVRDADLVAFHLSAIRQSEAPGVERPTPSGLFVEEACQICRYAGMSDKLTSFGIYGYSHERDRDAQTAQVTAQMLWYFLDGFFSRKGDYPTTQTGLTEYVVYLRKLNYQITFWKSNKSGRWWMQVPVTATGKLERHRLIPCSLQDYQAACREELPERLLKAMERF